MANLIGAGQSDTDMTQVQLDDAYALTYQLLENKTYHDLTHNFIHILREIDGLLEAASYEVFDLIRRPEDDTQEPLKPEYLIRRFPLSLDSNLQDEYIHLIDQIVEEHEGGISLFVDGGDHYIILDVYKNVKPRRVILLKGVLSSADFKKMAGIFGVYERLVELLDSKERDTLTNLHNRQTMDLILTQVFQYYQDVGIDTAEDRSWVALLDIDHFKEVNDSFGHLYGDEVLLLFAGIMEKTFRHTDFLFRYGGEEFLVIINRVSKGGVEQALERFRAAVEKFEFPFGRVTVSIGYTFVNPKIAPRSLLEFADAALYCAKKDGRNCVMYSDQRAQEDKDINDVEIF